jgi:hypothetical protein
MTDLQVRFDGIVELVDHIVTGHGVAREYVERVISDVLTVAVEQDSDLRAAYERAAVAMVAAFRRHAPDADSVEVLARVEATGGVEKLIEAMKGQPVYVQIAEDVAPEMAAVVELLPAERWRSSLLTLHAVVGEGCAG